MALVSGRLVSVSDIGRVCDVNGCGATEDKHTGFLPGRLGWRCLVLNPDPFSLKVSALLSELDQWLLSPEEVCDKQLHMSLDLLFLPGSSTD